MSLARAILDNMLTAMFFTPSAFLIICIIGILTIYLAAKNHLIVGLISLTAATAIARTVLLNRYAQCESCIYVDRIYQYGAIWGLIDWALLFALVAILIKFRKSYRKKI